MYLFITYFVNLAIIGGSIYGMKRSFSESPNLRYFWSSLSFKVLCGILLGLLFHHFYQHGDTLTYYASGRAIAEQSWDGFWNTISSGTVPSQEVRAIYFTRMIAVLIKLTQADYWLMSIYFSLLSFLGSFFLANQLTLWKDKLQLPAVVGFLYLPSVVFWSSGLLKESLAFGCLTYLVGIYIRYRRGATFRSLSTLVGACALVFLVVLKYYIAAPLLPLLLYLLLYRGSSLALKLEMNMASRSTVILILLIVPSYLFFSFISYNLTFDRLWMIIQQSHELFIQVSGDQVILPIRGCGLVVDLILNIPYYIFSTLFRPLIGEFWKFPILLSAIENLLILACTIYMVWKTNLKKTTIAPELIAVLVYVSSLCLFLGYSSPNFGTLARYKVYFLPFFILLLEAPINSLNKYLKK